MDLAIWMRAIGHLLAVPVADSGVWRDVGKTIFVLVSFPVTSFIDAGRWPLQLRRTQIFFQWRRCLARCWGWGCWPSAVAGSEKALALLTATRRGGAAGHYVPSRCMAVKLLSTQQAVGERWPQL